MGQTAGSRRGLGQRRAVPRRAGAAGDGGGRRGRFSIVAPQFPGAAGQRLRFGLENESARLNLGALLRWDEREPGAAQRALLALPGMTPAIADAILDWIDPDAAPRPQGAEDDYYRGLGVPYGPRNGVPQCLEELLLVRDVTRELVFGSQPDAAALTAPAGDAGGSRPGWAALAADATWAALLTVCSAERNETLDGRPRINVNRPELAELHQQLAEAWSVPPGRFHRAAIASTGRTKVRRRPLRRLPHWTWRGRPR